MHININSILEAQNKTVFYLAKEINCDYHSLMKMCNGETKSISFNLLERICLSLNCTPSEILIIDNESTQK